MQRMCSCLEYTGDSGSPGSVRRGGCAITALVQPQNFDIYGKIAWGVVEKGYGRDTLQCSVQIKELWQAYQKVRQANRRSGAELQTYCFYRELHAVLGSEPTSIPKSPVGTSGLELLVTGVNTEDDVLDEEVEAEENGGQATGRSSGMESQDLLLSPEQSS
ncbi:hypothetical protein UY3_15917 [Chelonia mydas]|uniref:Zinc finger and SCAN domain-containing protein 29 n=1 Tax=Chelonia mydas TaxID=8469 RepID=M7B4C6_CHEMY|nr:hypothetical protein UY3_15917 [Chelonia mydas]